jgi:hypothetical protein
MPQLKEIQKKFPAAFSSTGRVIVFHDGQHYELGKHVGEGVVVLSPEGEKLLAPKKSKKEPADIKGVSLDDLSSLEV